MRKVKKEDFAGKAILSIDVSSLNVITFKFFDGTKLDLWAEIVNDLPYLVIYDEEVAPCPFCGFIPSIDDPDFCHLVGRTTLWQAGCIESAGGCTAKVLGDTKEEAIANWNKRASKE